MPKYLSQQTIKEAVDRLAVSATSSSLADYLIFKRALKIAIEHALKAGSVPPDSVVTGTRSGAFVQAIDEFALRVPPGNADPKTMANPYYLPFGARRDDTLGYRSKKFPSNGSSDTVSRWQSRENRPLALVSGTSPKAYQFEPRTRKELENFFNVKTASDNFSGEKPRLLDSAIWWFRFADLEARLGEDIHASRLVEAFVNDFGLTEAEISALFAISQNEEGTQSEAVATSRQEEGL